MQEFVYAKINLKLLNRIDMYNVDIYEIANYCIELYKNSLSHTSNKYDGTEFFAITEDNQVLYSTTPHILKNAVQAILVHKYLYQYLDYWNPLYDIDYIDAVGRASKGYFDDRHRLTTYSGTYPLDIYIQLNYGSEILYYKKNAYMKTDVPRIWELYTRVKEVETVKEKMLVAELFQRDEQILKLEKEVENFKFTTHFLEQERDQYKGLLDEIKQLITPRQ